MPPATKKRKTARAGVTKTTVTAPSPQRGIQAFGKISKSHAGRPPAGKSKARAKEQSSQPSLISCVVDVPEASIPSRKRKAQYIDDCPDTDDKLSKHKKTKSDFDDNAGKVRYPKTPQKKALSKSIAVETPTNGARTCLESLGLSSSPISRQVSSPPSSRADTLASSPPPTKRPEDDREDNSVLPDELQDLVNLHSSFLTALSLHYAHHGSLAPVDFRNLRPNIERAWRKRRVSIQDIQRILALQQLSPPTPSKLSLSDYGSSKICLEIEASAHHLSLHRRLLNEEQLNKIFQANLLDRWTSHKGSAENLVSSLPLLPITPCTSTTALAPLLAKGQRRLEDLKAGAIRAQARSQRNIPFTKTNEDANSSDAENIPPSSTEAISKPPPPSLTARKTSLFDRIRAKQEAHLLSSSLKTPLNPSQLLRKSALRRIEEIVPVLELLCSGLGVKTFTMATVVQHLQMSLRNPIEKEEASRAVRLLAEEVAQGWVGVKEVGKVVGVTVRREGMVGGRAGVMRRVRELAEGL